MPQLSIDRDPARFRAGMLADNGPVRDVTLANEGSANVLHGRGVDYGTDPEKQFSLAALAGVFAGILAGSHIKDDEASDGIAQNEEARIVRGGVIAVDTVDAVTVGGPVFLSTAVDADQGKFGAAGDLDVSAFCEWRSSTSGAGIAALEINLK